VPDAPIRWAGFVENDALLVATSQTLHRAATPADAIAGRFEPLEKIDPSATTITSGGSIVLAAAPGHDGTLYESRDGGRHLAPTKRPARGAILRLAVRSDGLVAAALETGTFQRNKREVVHAATWTRRGQGPWVQGPAIDSMSRDDVLNQSGDFVSVLATSSTNAETMGLDAAGRWIKATWPEHWVAYAWTNGSFAPRPPEKRPGFARLTLTRSSSGGGPADVLSWGPHETCEGVACLAHRRAVLRTPIARAFQDAECAREHVVTTTEKNRECDPARPARRMATLVLRSPSPPRVVRLPASCAKGQVVATDRAAFVQCEDAHRGKSALLALSSTGALTDAVASGTAVAALDGAESASDGTTVLFQKAGALVCRPTGKECAAVPRDGYLAARPLPDGRALVARTGANAHVVVLEVFGERDAKPVEVRTPLTLLDVEVTDHGNVRVWGTTDSYDEWRQSPWVPAVQKRVQAFLVRADGELVADPGAPEFR
jgi:hypothetical protein